jgi:hypothetical protein
MIFLNILQFMGKCFPPKFFQENTFLETKLNFSLTGKQESLKSDFPENEF